jgi:GTPase SAR1 family protein
MLSMKVVVIGEVNAGKSSILRRLRDGRFSPVEVPAPPTDLPVDFVTRVARHVPVVGLRDTRDVSVTFWDPVGLDRHRSVPGSFYRDADGVLLGKYRNKEILYTYV